MLELKPFVKNVSFKIEPSNLENKRADFQLLMEELALKETSIELLREIPRWLRAHNFCGAALICGERLIALEESADYQKNYAVAIDLGTTKYCCCFS